MRRKIKARRRHGIIIALIGLDLFIPFISITDWIFRLITIPFGLKNWLMINIIFTIISFVLGAILMLIGWKMTGYSIKHLFRRSFRRDQ